MSKNPQYQPAIREEYIDAEGKYRTVEAKPPVRAKRANDRPIDDLGDLNPPCKGLSGNQIVFDCRNTRSASAISSAPSDPEAIPYLDEYFSDEIDEIDYIDADHSGIPSQLFIKFAGKDTGERSEPSGPRVVSEASHTEPDRAKRESGSVSVNPRSERSEPPIGWEPPRWGSDIPRDTHDVDPQEEARYQEFRREQWQLHQSRQEELPLLDKMSWHQKDPIEMPVIKKKATENLLQKNYTWMLQTAGKYYVQTGQSLVPDIHPLLLEQYKEMSMMEESVERLSGKIPPRDIVAFWITLNPPFEGLDPEDVLNTLKTDIDKIKGKYISHREWVFENRADTIDDLGRGIHAHVLAYTTLRKPDETHKFAQFVRDFEKRIVKQVSGKTYIVRCDAKSLIPRQKYIHGQKNRSKIKRVEYDRIFRRNFGLSDIYQDKPKSSKN